MVGNYNEPCISMTNERAEKGASAAQQPMESQETWLGAGLDIDKISELRLSWHLV